MSAGRCLCCGRDPVPLACERWCLDCVGPESRDEAIVRLAREGGRTQREIARLAGTSQATVSKTLARMRREGGA